LTKETGWDIPPTQYHNKYVFRPFWLPSLFLEILKIALFYECNYDGQRCETLAYLHVLGALSAKSKDRRLGGIRPYPIIPTRYKAHFIEKFIMAFR